jgi:hypothetical protein
MRKGCLIAAALGLAETLCFGEGPAYQLHGQAWTEYGRIVTASDSLLPGKNNGNLTLDLNGNPIVSMGGQFTIQVDLAEHWDAAFGFGAYKASHALGHGQKSFLTISMFQNFLTESRLTWYQGDKAAPGFSVTLGSFPYKYNPDVQNLGLYLLRGPVYPGVLMGGFRDFAVDTSKATQLGLKVHHAIGNFSHDLILNSERDIPPTFDMSLAYVAKYRAFDAVEFGAGVNFYRLIPYDKSMQTPGKLSDDKLSFHKENYIEVDPANPADTVFFTHQGIKAMGMFSVDFKSLMGIGNMGKDDLKLYGEAAIIGLKNYGKTYSKISERIPVMLGFNFPVFNYLDHLSLELEYYGSPYRNDLKGLGNNNVVADWTIQDHPVPSPKPVSNAEYGIDSAGNWTNATGQVINMSGTGLLREKVSTDDFKWSVFVDKTVKDHIRFTGQVANDHYRPRPVATGLIASAGGLAEAFSESSNWYFMLRVGYLF